MMKIQLLSSKSATLYFRRDGFVALGPFCRQKDTEERDSFIDKGTNSMSSFCSLPRVSVDQQMISSLAVGGRID